MAETAPFVAHCMELLAPLGATRARRMFGGHGLYVDDLFVALIAGDCLYLRADESARPAFERAGCRPFTYSARDRQAVAMGYWSAPEEALDSAPAMLPWARLAMASALRAKAEKRNDTAAAVSAKSRRKAAAPPRPARSHGPR
jgi:DNA transformation protein and related proteins